MVHLNGQFKGGGMGAGLVHQISLIFFFLIQNAFYFPFVHTVFLLHGLFIQFLFSLLRFYFDNIEMIKFQFTVTERERDKTSQD